MIKPHVIYIPVIVTHINDDIRKMLKRRKCFFFSFKNINAYMNYSFFILYIKRKINFNYLFFVNLVLSDDRITFFNFLE